MLSRNMATTPKIDAERSLKAFKKAGFDVDPQDQAQQQAHLQMRAFQSRISGQAFVNFLKKRETRGVRRGQRDQCYHG